MEQTGYEVLLNKMLNSLRENKDKEYDASCNIISTKDLEELIKSGYSKDELEFGIEFLNREGYIKRVVPATSDGSHFYSFQPTHHFVEYHQDSLNLDLEKAKNDCIVFIKQQHKLDALRQNFILRRQEIEQATGLSNLESYWVIISLYYSDKVKKHGVMGSGRHFESFFIDDVDYFQEYEQF